MLNPRPPFLKHPFSWLGYLFLWLIAQLPYSVLIFLGKGFGTLLHFGLKSRAKVTKTNLQLCFPEKSQEQINKLSGESFSELGMMVTQTLKTFFGTQEVKNDSFEIKGSDHLQQCIDNNDGVLLVAGHFTALDVGGKILCKHFPIAGMYRQHKHPVAEYLVRKSRLKYATKMFGRDELRPTIKHLKQGGILWYAPDQDYRRGQSVFVDFFNQKASTITATHQLARLSKCKVIMFAIKRNDKKPYYTLELSPALENFPSKNTEADTQRINFEIEKMVSANPEQYLWMHKRFKTQENGKPNPY